MKSYAYLYKIDFNKLNYKNYVDGWGIYQGIEKELAREGLDF